MKIGIAKFYVLENSYVGKTVNIKYQSGVGMWNMLNSEAHVAFSIVGTSTKPKWKIIRNGEVSL